MCRLAPDHGVSETRQGDPAQEKRPGNQDKD